MDETRVVTFARAADFALDVRVHCLEVVDGLEQGRVIILKDNGGTLGRSPPADIVLNDSEVSRSHCRFTIVSGALRMADLNSTNGTFVNGHQVTGEAVLKPGQILRLGQVEIRLEDNTAQKAAAKKLPDQTMVIPQGVKLGQEPSTKAVPFDKTTFAKKSNTANKVFIVMIVVLVIVVLAMAAIFILKK